MSNFDYPKVKLSLGRAALYDPYPAYFLDSRGVIYAANLMAFWLWNMLRPGEPVRADALLGTCVFNILADNFERIPADQNAGFYVKRSAFVKRMDANLNSPLYTSFISAMKANPALARIYDQAVPQVEHEWDYSLSITPPGEKDSSSLLEFQVTVYRIEGDSGFLVMYSPTAATLPVVEKQYTLLTSTYGDTDYVLLDERKQDNGDSNLFLASLTNSFRPYYPTLGQDSLWYITTENRAHHLLVGASVVGMHFFELFFAPQLHEWMGPLQETSAPRAIRYFDMFTASFLREDHELHAGYEQVMKRLLQLPEFAKVLDISRKLNIHINVSNNPEVPFYTCRVILPWALSYETALQFRSMVRFMYKSPFIATDRRYYQVTLIPENDETEVALILLHLAPTGLATDDTGNASLKQFLWGLAILKTVKEGLTRKDEGDMQWEPESAFERMHTELIAGSAAPLEDIDDALAELRVIIETLDRKGMVDKEVLLTMLKSCAASIHLDRLSDFCTRELEIYKKVKV